MKIRFFIVYIFFSTILPAQEIPELITDRPDQTESAAVIATGWLQVETGVSFEHTKIKDLYGEININEYSIAGTLARYGLSEKLELRFGAGYFISETGTISDNYGFGDFMIGTKYMLPVKEIDMAVLSHIALPIGDDSFSPKKIEPEIILAAAKPLNNNISLGINLGGNWDSQIEEVSVFYSSALGFALTEKLGSFLEVYGNLNEKTHKFDFGFTYLSSSHIQFDTSAGINLNGNEQNWFISGGVSFRITD